MTDRPELADLARLARRAMQGFVATARAGERETLPGLLTAHLGDGAKGLPVIEEAWPAYEHVNVQAGLDAWLAEPSRSSRLVGVIGFQHHDFGLGELLASSGDDGAYGPRPGNVARANLPCGPGEVRPCVVCGLYLVTEGEQRAAVFLRNGEGDIGSSEVRVQVAGTDPALAQRTAAAIRALTVEHNVFRGQVLSFSGEVFGREGPLLHFHPRPALRAAQLVLPEETLAAVQRQVVEVARHKARLLAAGQHLKRGILLYGPPGVGKTHTVRYLMSRLTETTVIGLSGEALHLVGAACSVARALQPAMLVVEDVDLIAEERSMHGGPQPLLFELLNEMDGLAEDADVVFVLTTNRAELLEPALAARPGRIDQAVELELPDRAARRRLFELYRGSLEVEERGLDDVLERTDGVTASFLKELLRRAALVAAERSPEQDGLAVSAADLADALDELLLTRNAMTRVLLGGAAPDDRPED
jgi:hypothetical protein